MIDEELHMKRDILAVFSIAVLGAAVFASPAQAASPPMVDGLVAVPSYNFDHVYLRPDADLGGYRKIIIDQPRVAFQPGWRKSINSTRNVSRWLVPDDERKIIDDLTADLGLVVHDVFQTRGYEVAAAAGPGVLRLTPSVIDLYLNAPDVSSSMTTRLYNVDTADATLVLEARDAVTGSLLARIVDQSTVRELKRVNRVSDVSNVFSMDAAFRQWTANCVKEFQRAERVSSSAPTAK
jgi:hypothetical protein